MLPLLSKARKLLEELFSKNQQRKTEEQIQPRVSALKTINYSKATKNEIFFVKLYRNGTEDRAQLTKRVIKNTNLRVTFEKVDELGHCRLNLCEKKTKITLQKKSRDRARIKQCRTSKSAIEQCRISNLQIICYICYIWEKERIQC